MPESIILRLAENNLLTMLLWLGELIISSWVLSYGAEHLSMKYGAKFVGRTLLSIATTLPEIAIVTYAAADGFYGIAIGAGLGSNLLMMTLGLAIMLLIATTRLSRAPLKGIPVGMFKLDKIFLLATAVISAALFVDGYNFLDGFAFSALFIAYIIMAFLEMKEEKKSESLKNSEIQKAENKSRVIEIDDPSASVRTFDRAMLKAVLAFVAGTIGIVMGAGPFIHSMQEFSLEIGISVIILAVIISPIAGEMPEKISMMILARKGAAGASIAIANVLGSKILNNTLLLAVAVFGAMFHAGFYTTIELTTVLLYQVILVTVVTIIALVPLFKKEIGLKVGILLASMYLISLFIQFLLPQEVALH
ncbi:MAG: calcium/cation antiporter family protein [Nitrososphaeraceae archaeon]|nr:calcium/cation antiporter family protein [Nitrososphaeraceae archaeon]